MKKILGITLGLGLLIGACNFDKALIESMKIVDAYGILTGKEVVTQIDKLNELWYGYTEAKIKTKMNIVDTVGSITGTDVSLKIDELNEQWYDLYE